MSDRKSKRDFSRQFLATSIATVVATGLSAGAVAEPRILEEIIVSAQKRSESVQDVPIAISAFSADTIENLSAQNLDDLGKFTPGLETDVNNETQAGFTIRGIKSTGFGSGEESAVGIYVDGVYTATSGGALVNFSDIERVEVVKGPQGTLFGRNATSGAISIFTNRPNAETEGKVKLTLGSHGRKDFDGIFNTALNDEWYMRAAISVQRDDGIYDNATGPDLEQDDSQTYNLSFLYNGFEDTEVWVKFDYNKLAIRNSSDISSNPLLNPAAVAGDPQQGAFEDRRTDVEPEENRELFGAAVIVDHEFNEQLSLKSITSYREFDANNFEDEDGWDNPFFFAASDNIEEQDQFSQEFTLNYVGDEFKWSAGFNYYKENREQAHVIQFNRLTLEQFATSEVLSELDAAGFLPIPLDDASAYRLMTGTGPDAPILAAVWEGFITAPAMFGGFGLPAPRPYTLGDGLGVFLAANGSDLGLPPAAIPGLVGLIGTGMLEGLLPVNGDVWEEITYNDKTTESYAIYGDFTWSVTDRLDLFAGARYTVDDKEFEVNTAYQNFLLPAFNPPVGVPAGLAFFTPGADKGEETYNSFTARAGANFHFNEDVMAYVTWSEGFKPGGFNSFLVGAAEVIPFDEEEISNVEIGLKGTWLDGRLRANLAYYDFEYDNLQELELSEAPIPLYETRTSDLDGDGFEIEVSWLATDNLLLAANWSHTETEYTDYGLLTGQDADDDKTGQPSTDVPEDKYNVFVEYTLPLGEAGALRTNLSYNWTDERTARDSDEQIDEYEVVNLRVSYDSGSSWELAAWAKNLHDEEYVYSIGGTGSAIGSSPISRGPGRTWGVDFIYNF